MGGAGGNGKTNKPIRGPTSVAVAVSAVGLAAERTVAQRVAVRSVASTERHTAYTFRNAREVYLTAAREAFARGAPHLWIRPRSYLPWLSSGFIIPSRGLIGAE